MKGLFLMRGVIYCPDLARQWLREFGTGTNLKRMLHGQRMRLRVAV